MRAWKQNVVSRRDQHESLKLTPSGWLMGELYILCRVWKPAVVEMVISERSGRFPSLATGCRCDITQIRSSDEEFKRMWSSKAERLTVVSVQDRSTKRLSVNWKWTFSFISGCKTNHMEQTDSSSAGGSGRFPNKGPVTCSGPDHCPDPRRHVLHAAVDL